MFDTVSPDEIDFLRLMLKCDANLSQEKKHLKTKLARKDFSEYVEVIHFVHGLITRILPSYDKCCPRLNLTPNDARQMLTWLNIETD